MKPIRARMKPDLVPLMAAHFGAMSLDDEQIAFYKLIEGRTVTLIFNGGDAFEQQDDNHWLPNDTWDAIA